MSRAPELEVITKLRADTVLMASVTAVYQDVPERGVRFPFLVVTLVGDSNEKQYLSYYGGTARVQVDIYARERSPELRAIVKDALRRIRGDVGDITITVVRIANEIGSGLSSDGLYRYVIDADVDYTVD